MSLRNKFKAFTENPKLLLVFILHRCADFVSDKHFVEIEYYCSIGKRLQLNNPQTFNEKLNWLKLYNKNPEYTKLVDKFAVKEYVSKLVGEQYVIPTIGIWDKFEEIDFSKLPNKFVLKTTHGGGNLGVVICKDKKTFDIVKAKNILNKSLASDSYKLTKEWPYKNVRRRIIAEEFISDGSDNFDLMDYKFFCFNGIVKGLFVASERQRREEPYFDFYDENFVHIDVRQGHPNSPQAIDKPSNFELMKELASKLSKGFPHIRVDLYNINGKVYFGELTFFHFGGVVPFHPDSIDKEWGQLISLPPKMN